MFVDNVNCFTFCQVQLNNIKNTNSQIQGKKFQQEQTLISKALGILYIKLKRLTNDAYLEGH